MSEKTTSEIRTLTLASLGGALEFYDFVIFVFFTSVLAKLFFAASLPDWVRQLDTFGIFAAGYLARPLGGIVMAHFGDTRGRKRMFTLSILLMAIPTLLIGLLPTYQNIGIAAPVLLLVMRVTQGIAMGGEAPGGWVFVAEHAGKGRIGLAVGLLTSGLSLGILLGSLVATTVNIAFTPAQIAHGVWRWPFLIGGAFGFIAMFLRRWLQETPVFEEIRRRAAISRELPLRAVLRDHFRSIVASVLSTWMLSAAIVVVALMTPTLLQQLFKLPARETQLANLAGSAALCLSTVAVGAATDRFGLRRVTVPMLLLLIAGTYSLYIGAQRFPSALILLYAIAGLGAGAAALTPILMVHAFPPQVRFSGVSFSYNVALAGIGGVTPLIVSWLVHFNRLSAAHYVALAAVFGGVGSALVGVRSVADPKPAPVTAT
jgi:MFS family permease